MAFRKPMDQEPRTFFPPLAMQESVWDSIVSGDFINAKIFAFSRRSRKPGRVDTPKAIFVNTRVLETACSYFQSTFSFSDGIETDINADLPPGIEPFFDLEGCDLDSDFDDHVEDDPEQSQPYPSSEISESSQRPIKAYIVKYTAYKTLYAILWYIYSGEIIFSSSSPEVPRVSARSVYRFADEHRMGHLKTLAFEEIKFSIDQLSPAELVEEACSVSTSRYPEWIHIYAERLPSVLKRDWDTNFAFRKKVSAYFSGELPHCKEIITSTLSNLLDLPNHDVCDEPAGGYSTISRVSLPWPDGTKEALHISLDNGTFDDIKLAVFCGPEATARVVHFPRVLVGDTANIERRVSRASWFSLLTWQALAYYAYTDGITFKPLGPENAEPPVGLSLSDPQFRGRPCSMKELYSLASQLRFFELTDIVATELSSSITLENVVEEMFSGLQLPLDAIDHGVKIIRKSGNRSKRHIHSQLREMLAEAADGSRLRDRNAVVGCLNILIPLAGKPFE